MDDVETLALNPTDQLLNVCLHGAVGSRLPPIRWVADVMAVLRSSETEVDWDRLAAHAEKRRLGLPLRDTLGYVKRILDAPIPETFLDSLDKMPTSFFEHTVYQSTLGPSTPTRKFLRTWMQYVRYERGTGGGNLQPHILRVPKYLQRRWRLEHLWQVPIWLVKKLKQRIRPAAARRP